LKVPEVVDGQNLGVEDADASLHARRRKADDVVHGNRGPERSHGHADRQVCSDGRKHVTPVERV
jgi:hypothetical protein